MTKHKNHDINKLQKGATMENEKQINLTNFEKCRNIKLDDVGKFLKENGYYWSEYINDDVQENDINEYTREHKFYFNKRLGKEFRTYNHFLILLLKQFRSIEANCNNNKWVRYIYFSISEFKVFEVLTDKKHPRYLTTKLEKDLSKEWVQFLAKQKEDYKPSLIQLMIKRKKQAEESLETSKEQVKKEKAELDKYLEKRIVETNQEINLANTTTEWLEELN